MSPRPFLTPAYLHAKNTNLVENELVNTISNEIKKLQK